MKTKYNVLSRAHTGGVNNSLPNNTYKNYHIFVDKLTPCISQVILIMVRVRVLQPTYSNITFWVAVPFCLITQLIGSLWEPIKGLLSSGTVEALETLTNAITSSAFSIFTFRNTVKGGGETLVLNKDLPSTKLG